MIVKHKKGHVNPLKNRFLVINFSTLRLTKRFAKSRNSANCPVNNLLLRPQKRKQNKFSSVITSRHAISLTKGKTKTFHNHNTVLNN